jgi:hypothetical protein
MKARWYHVAYPEFIEGESLVLVRKGGSFFVEKESIAIMLQGSGAKDYIQRRNIPVATSGEDFFVLAAEGFMRKPEHWLVQQIGSYNREVVVYSWKLGKGRKGFRKVSVNREGCGRQQVTNDVWLVVQTEAPREIFARNIR